LLRTEGRGSIETFGRRYLERLQNLLQELDFEALDAVVQALERARKEGYTVYIMGNGGSASTATHMAQDLAFGTRMRSGPRIRAISLTDNAAYLSACANDIGYENVFEQQLRNLMQPGDVVLAISASGNSPNVVKAVDYANEHGGETIAFVGFDGGRLKQRCKYVVHAASESGEYGPVEDVHMILDHLITAYLVDGG
jgi:D-sedoheptulose 7-phosphate isomerase